MTKLVLRDTQKAALHRLCEPGRTFAALWAEPRSGKTAVALKYIEHLAPEVVLIVAPKIAERVWRVEANLWLTKPFRFFSLTDGNVYPPYSSVTDITLLFVNYEQFTKSPFRRLGPWLRNLADRFNHKLMILDESHAIKTPSSITGRNIRPLALTWEYRLIMTGTPVTNPNQIDAIYGQWTFLDPTIRHKWRTAASFRDYFGVWSTIKGYPELIRPRNQWELNKYLQPNVITMTGPQSSLLIEKSTYKAPSVIYKLSHRLIHDGVVPGKTHTIVGLNPLTRLLRLRQIIAGWCVDDKDNMFTIPKALNARLAHLSGILATTKGKVIISCTHLFEVRLVERYLTQQGRQCHVITGKVKNKNTVIEKFQYATTDDILIVQPRTVSMAVDISAADTLIWYSSDFNYVTFKQTSDRIKLSLKNPRVYFICAENSVDEDVWVTLQEDSQHLQKTIKNIRKIICVKQDFEQ